MNSNYRSVDEYIGTFPTEVQVLLEEVRAVIRKKAPEAVENIAYGMPAYKCNGKPLLYFAGYKKHIGFYAIPSAHLEFADELLPYKRGKGSVQFPVDKPIPLELIGRMVEFRVKENASKAKK